LRACSHPLPAHPSLPTRRSSDLGDNGPATSAVLSAPAGLVVDTAGNLLISDRGYAHDRIRKVDISTGIITSDVTSLRNPLGIAVDRKSTRLNSSHVAISYAVFCL